MNDDHRKNVTSCIFWDVCLRKSNMLFNVDMLYQLDDDMSPIIVMIIYSHFEYYVPLHYPILYNEGFVIRK